MAYYLNDAQREQVLALQQSFTARTEWPTWLALIWVYGAWFSLVHFYALLGPVLGTALLALNCAFFMSVQHELVHGHPTRWTGFNKLLGYAPLAVWFPYTLYVQTHLKHHQDENLTLPGVDPETNYVSAQTWAGSGAFMRGLYRARLSFWGRFLFGPAMSIHAIVTDAMGQLRRGDLRNLGMWFAHGALTVLMLWWVQRVSGMHPVHYLLGVAYPALSIAMVRSYFEHRATAHCKQRIATNEASWPMRLLYLNNNFHLTHHDMPGLAWYVLPKVYWPQREAYLARNAGFRFLGYAPLAWRYGFRPIDAPTHPGLAEDRSSLP